MTDYAKGMCTPLTWRATWAAANNGLHFQVSYEGPDIGFLCRGNEWQQID